MTFPMTESPILDGEAATNVRWWGRLINPVNRALAALDTDDTGWTAGTYLNSWATRAGWTGAAYRRRHGVVYLRGLVQHGAGGGTSLTTIFKLPDGFWPEFETANAVHAGGGGARVDIDASDGSVEVLAYNYGGSDDYVSLFGISFIPGLPIG